MTDNNALAQELDTIIDQAIGDAEDHITMSFDTAEAILAALRTAGEVGHKRDHGPSCCCAHCQLDAWKDEQSERQATVGQEVARIVSLSDERGDFVTGPDGCVIWWPDDLKQGGLNAWHLRSLADELDRRNADWFAQMAAAFPLTTQPAPASGEVGELVKRLHDQDVAKAADMLERLAGSSEVGLDEAGFERIAKSIASEVDVRRWDDIPEYGSGDEIGKFDLKRAAKAAVRRMNILRAQPTQQPGDQVELIDAAKAVIASAFDHYTARNGRRMSIEGDDGEKCWIVPFDDFEQLRFAVERAAIAAMPSGEVGQPDMRGVDLENAAWAWLEKKFGTPNDDPVDRVYDASEMVDAFHARPAA